MEILHGLSRVKDLLDLSGKAVFILWLVSWAIALFAGTLLDGKLRQWGRLGTWAFAAYLLGLLIWNIGGHVSTDRRHLHLLKTLSRTERVCLQLYIEQDTASVNFGFGDGPPRSLVAKGILSVPSVPEGAYTGIPYILAPWASDILRKHRGIPT